MDLETFASYNWKAMIPEFIILFTIIVVSLVDLFWENDKKKRVITSFILVGLIGAFSSLLMLSSTGVIEILYGTFRLDSFAKALKIILLLGTFFVAIQTLDDKTIASAKYKGEYYYLLLCALLGAMFLVSSADLITMFVGLELLSIASYILVAIRRDSKKANEAALKYVINGSIASALTLFGMSYLYGITGTTNIYEMKLFLQNTQYSEALWILLIAWIFILVGLSFKIAIVPFHMWAPDVYEGATIPVTTFLSVVSKAAGFGIFLRLFYIVFANIPLIENTDWIIAVIMSMLAVTTIILANIIALRQKTMKRLLAYSSIAHAGMIFIPLTVNFSMLPSSILFYLLVYTFMNVGVFTIIQILVNNQDNQLQSFNGLYKRKPFLAISMAVFLLSLAGIPGTSGFIAKVSIILSIYHLSDVTIFLAIGIIIATIISYIYYFSILVRMFSLEPESRNVIELNYSSKIVIMSTLLITIILGILPNLGLGLLFQDVTNIFTFF